MSHEAPTIDLSVRWAEMMPEYLTPPSLAAHKASTADLRGAD